MFNNIDKISIIFFVLLVGCFFFAVFMDVLINRHSFKEAFKTVGKAIYDFLKTVPLEPVPWETPGFTERVIRALKKYSSITDESLYWDDCSLRGQYRVEFIGTEEQLHIFEAVLFKLVTIALKRQGYKPIVYIFTIQKNPFTWIVTIWYASLPKSKERLKNRIENETKQKREEAVSSLNAPVDKELEQEIAETKEKEQAHEQSD